MTTNLIASILVVLVTNTVEHWPMRWVSDGRMAVWNTPRARWVQHGDMMSPEAGVDTPDTNADSMSVETTVTRQRLLNVPFEGRTFTETLTNEPHLHYSVEMQRVTNEWRTILETKNFDVADAINRARAEGIRVLNGAIYTIQQLCQTNYFVPVKTNSLPLVQQLTDATNCTMPLSSSLVITNVGENLSNGFIIRKP